MKKSLFIGIKSFSVVTSKGSDMKKGKELKGIAFGELFRRKGQRAIPKGIAFGGIFQKKYRQAMPKGIAFDEGVNAMIFLACIIILGIMFAVSGISIVNLLAIGTNFVSQVSGELVRAITAGIL
jgi:hypothetical protein